MSLLRRVLAEVRAAPGGTGLDEVARRLGATRDQVDAAVGYWVHRGDLVVDEVDCASTGCAGCRFGAGGSGGCPRGGTATGDRSGPVLLTITARPPGPRRPV